MANQAPQAIPNSAPQELDKPKLLVGEGKDEIAIFGALLNHLRINDVKIEDFGGKHKLPDYLDALIRRPGFANLTSLAVTRDADNDPPGAFTSLRNHLGRRGFSPPASSGNMEEGAPRIGILILPDGQNPGMLEDLCLSALQNDPSIRCIDEFFECVRTATRRLPAQISKARVHAWLAAQDPPDMRLGVAAQKGLIDWDNPCFDNLRAFLTAL